tara:strand:+ start:37 stop:264 length:228 start_codon:yes stop_codon:yes gene_type:complete
MTCVKRWELIWGVVPMAKKFEVIISENVGKTILVEANSEDEAWELVDGGNWDESMVIKKKLIDRLTCDVEELKDE